MSLTKCSDFVQLLVCTNMVDLAPACIRPTWRNGRSGVRGISKRLNRFLVSDSFNASLLSLSVLGAPVGDL